MVQSTVLFCLFSVSFVLISFFLIFKTKTTTKTTTTSTTELPPPASKCYLLGFFLFFFESLCACGWISLDFLHAFFSCLLRLLSLYLRWPPLELTVTFFFLSLYPLPWIFFCFWEFSNTFILSLLSPALCYLPQLLYHGLCMTFCRSCLDLHAPDYRLPSQLDRTLTWGDS